MRRPAENSGGYTSETTDGMAVRRLTSCCCGCGLQQGCTIIAIVCMVLNGLGALVMLLGLASEDTIREVSADPELFEGRRPTPAEMNALVQIVLTMLRASLAVFIISLLADVVLLVATQRRYRQPLLIWVVWYALLVMIGVGLALYLIAMAATSGNTSPEFWSVVFGQLISSAVSIYLLAVVVSYYLQLRDEHHGRAYAMQPVMKA